MKRYKLLILIFLVIMIMILSYIQFNAAGELELNATKAGADVISPYDHIKQEDINVYDDRVIIEIDNPEWAEFADTNSMDPVIDISSNVIQVVPKSESEVHVGDIVSYESYYADGIIIHRVINIDFDEQGWYAEIKGDNLPFKDPGKVRFNQIKKTTVGIVY